MFITGPDVIKTVTGEEVELRGARRRDDATTRSRASRTSPPTTRTSASRTRATCSRSCRRTTSRRRRACCRPTTRCAWTTSSTRVVPDNPNKPYDMRDVVRLIVDDGEFFEVHEHYAHEHRLRLRAPRTATRSASSATSRRAMAGVLDIDASREGRALRAHLRRVQHPDRSRSSTSPASCPAPTQEWGGIIRHGAKLLYAFAEATVPKITVITRKAYGGAYDVMASKHLRRRLQLRLADGRGRGDGPRGRGQHHLPPRHRAARRRPTSAARS